MIGNRWLPVSQNHTGRKHRRTNQRTEPSARIDMLTAMQLLRWHLCVTPLLCRKWRPCAMSNAKARPLPHQEYSPVSSADSACRRSPPAGQQKRHEVSLRFTSQHTGTHETALQRLTVLLTIE